MTNKLLVLSKKNQTVLPSFPVLWREFHNYYRYLRAFSMSDIKCLSSPYRVEKKSVGYIKCSINNLTVTINSFTAILRTGENKKLLLWWVCFVPLHSSRFTLWRRIESSLTKWCQKKKQKRIWKIIFTNVKIFLKNCWHLLWYVVPCPWVKKTYLREV